MENQTFLGYMKQFMTEKQIKEVVEVGSDIQLKIAFNLARYCNNFYSVNFQEDHARMRGWYEMHQKMGAENITLLSGDALKLSSLINKAGINKVDLIIVHNVLLDKNNGNDTTLMWQYRRGEKECSEDEWENLIKRFEQARELGYSEFLKVANPGYIITFANPESAKELNQVLVKKLEVNPSKIEQIPLLYDGEDLTLDTIIIENK